MAADASLEAEAALRRQVAVLQKLLGTDLNQEHYEDLARAGFDTEDKLKKIKEESVRIIFGGKEKGELAYSTVVDWVERQRGARASLAAICPVPEVVIPQGYKSKEEVLQAAMRGELKTKTFDEEVAIAQALYQQGSHGPRTRSEPSSPHYLPKLMKSMVLQQHSADFIRHAGVSCSTAQRRGPLPQEISDLGSHFLYMERESSAQVFTHAVKVIAQRQGTSTMSEGYPFLGMVSLPGGGKSTAAVNLLPLAVKILEEAAAGGGALSAEDQELLPQLEKCMKYRRQYVYDFASTQLQGFETDKAYKLHPEQSISLRLLHMLTGEGENFNDFMRLQAERPTAELFFRYLKVAHVRVAAEHAWREADIGGGAVHIIFDEVGAAVEESAEEQKMEGSNARRLNDMLAHWDIGTRSPERTGLQAPVAILSVLGTRLTLTLMHSGQLRSNSGIARAAFIPLTALSDQAILDIICNIYMRLRKEPGIPRGLEQLKLWWRIIAALVGGVPRLLEAFLAACALLLGQGDADQPPPPPSGTSAVPARQTRWQVDSEKLLKALSSHTVNAEKLRIVCGTALDMLRVRSPALHDYVDSDQRIKLAQAILAQQMMPAKAHGVKRKEPIMDGSNITWGDTERDGLVAMKPRRTDRTCLDLAEEDCDPEMAYLIFVGWMKKLEVQNLHTVPIPDTFCSFINTLTWQTKEALDLGGLLQKLYILQCWLRKDVVMLAQLLPLDVNMHKDFCDYAVQVPALSQLDVKYGALPSRDELEEELNKCSTGKLSSVARLGPGNQKSVDWLLILRVDATQSKGKAQQHSWFIIEGQSKMHQQVGGQNIGPSSINKEQEKMIMVRPEVCKAATLFLLVTDRVAPANRSQTDRLVIGSNDLQYLYGRQGAKKRRLMADIVATGTTTP